MIFSTFMLDTRPSLFEQLDGATGGPINKLKRLMQISARRLSACEPTLAELAVDIDEDKEHDHDQPTDQPVSPGSPGATQPSDKAHGKANNADWQLDCKYTLKEVQLHSTLDDCWMVIFDKVYNITDFVYDHPGGEFILLEYAGQDATQPFLSSRHGSSAYKLLDKYWIGILVDEELYYSNNSSYCSVYSKLSWRSTPTSIEDTDNDHDKSSDDNDNNTLLSS